MMKGWHASAVACRTPDEIVAIIWEGLNTYLQDPAGYGHKELL